MRKLKCRHFFNTIPLILLSSCGTIMHGSSESVNISSIPSQAEVWVDNKYVGLSPTIVSLSRKDNHLIKVQLEGFEPYEMMLTRELSGWTFGNIVFGGFIVIGVAVDAITGGIYRLSSDQVQAQLRKGDVSMLEKSDASYFAVVMHPDPSWQKIGSLKAVN